MNKSLAIQLGKNLQTPNNQVPQVQVHMIFYCVDLEKHFTRKTSQILPIPKAAARKNTRKGGRKRASSRLLSSTLVRDEIVVNKTNRQTKIKKTKKARKSLICKVSSDSESEVELVLESDTGTEESDDEVIESDLSGKKISRSTIYRPSGYY